MVKQRNFHLHDGKLGAALAVRITPRMARNEIHEIMEDGTVKIRLTAPPVEGKANQALVEFLSKVLNVPSSSIDIIAGQTGRDKLITVMGLTSDQLQQQILQSISHQTK